MLVKYILIGRNTVMICMRLLSAALLLATVPMLFYAADMQIKKDIYCLILPGQNGMGGEDVKHDLAIMPEGTQYKRIETPEWFPDLGQWNCQRYLEKDLQPLQKNDTCDIFIYAISQGTATTINYVSEHSQSVKGLVLESVLPSGNDAIDHTTTELIIPWRPWIAYVPAKQYVLPYAARCMFPLYSPGGQQAIFAAHKLPTTLPAIIIHSEHDKQLSIKGAQALYYTLCMQGNDQVYFIQKTGSRHIWLLDKESEECDFVRSVINNKLIDATLKAKYQPDPAQFKNVYDALMDYERRIRKISYAISAGALLATIACMKTAII